MNSEGKVLRTQDSASEICKVKHCKEQLNAIVKSVGFQVVHRGFLGQ